MVQVILERQDLADDGTIKLANGRVFTYSSLTVGELGEQFQNSLRERFLFMGSLNVENDTLGNGVHYLLRDTNGFVRMILQEHFDRNFSKVNN